MRKTLFFAISIYVSLSFCSDVNELTLEQRVGQMFMFGFSGTSINKKLESHFRNLQPGGVIVFGRNIKTLSQTAKLTTDFQNLSLRNSGVPTFIAIDQEGGNVSRIKTSPSLPSAYTIGNTNDLALAFQAAKVTGEILHALGFNMNLAPVLDITDAQLTSFISSRSFSDSPQKVSTMGVAFAQGLEESKILPVAKHFPGHGSILLDTHRTTPHRQVSYQNLQASDLIPFTQFVNSDLKSGIMVAHISFPVIDESGLPATYSKQLVTNVLKNDLKYSGLVMTDDIEMAGAAALEKVEDRAVAAVLAGNDLIMLAWSPELQKRAVRAVIAAVKSGKIPMERINSSVAKIMKYKDHYIEKKDRFLASRAPDLKEELRKVPFKSVYNDIVSRFFKTLPGLSKSDSRYTSYSVISLSDHFLESFKRYIKTIHVEYNSRPSSGKKLSPSTLVVFHVMNQTSFQQLLALPPEVRNQTLVVSSYPKAHFQDKSAFVDVIEIFSTHPNLGGFTADSINRSQTHISSR